MAELKIRDGSGKVTKIKLMDESPYYLFDSNTWADSSVESIYFRDPAKDPVDTNIAQHSTLPATWMFEYHTIRVVPRQPITTADAKIMFAGTTLALVKDGDTESFRAPAIFFNSGCGLTGSGTDLVTLGDPDYNARMRLPKPLQIKGGLTFIYRVRHSPSLAGLGASRKVYISLDGIRRLPASGR